MDLDLHAKSPFQRILLLLKLYSLPVFIVIFGFATYCMAYDKAYEYRSAQKKLALAQDDPIQDFSQTLQAPQEEGVMELEDERLGEYFVDASVLNVRAAASIKAKVKFKLYRSDLVEVIGIEGEWAKIEGGYVLLKYLSRV